MSGWTAAKVLPLVLLLSAGPWKRVPGPEVLHEIDTVPKISSQTAKFLTS